MKLFVDLLLRNSAVKGESNRVAVSSVPALLVSGSTSGAKKNPTGTLFSF